MLSLGIEKSLQRLQVCVLTSLAVFAAATACGSDSRLHDSAGGDSKYRTGEQSAAASDSGSLTAAAAYGLGLRTTNSQELCEALRLGVDGSTFVRPVSQGRTSDYKPGLADSQIYIKCEIATADMEVESDPSGGGLYTSEGSHRYRSVHLYWSTTTHLAGLSRQRLGVKVQTAAS